MYHLLAVEVSGLIYIFFAKITGFLFTGLAALLVLAYFVHQATANTTSQRKNISKYVKQQQQQQQQRHRAQQQLQQQQKSAAAPILPIDMQRESDLDTTTSIDADTRPLLPSSSSNNINIVDRRRVNINSNVTLVAGSHRRARRSASSVADWSLFRHPRMHPCLRLSRLYFCFAQCSATPTSLLPIYSRSACYRCCCLLVWRFQFKLWC
jgi:hypothetical protein